MGYEKFNDQKSKFQLGIMLYDNLVSKDVTKVSNPQVVFIFIVTPSG